MSVDALLEGGEPVPIVRWGDPVLHRPARQVTTFDEGLLDLLRTMFATNRAARGAGLAAAQIGVDLAVFVYDCEDASGRRRPGVVCNPKLARLPGAREEVVDEGCLSLPGAFVPVARPDTAVCRGQDQHGHPITVRGTGVLARCLQHETDHTQGVVFEDHLSAEERRELRRRHTLAANEYPARWPAV